MFMYCVCDNIIFFIYNNITIKCAGGARNKNLIGTYDFWAGPSSPPSLKPPFRCPHQDKKGTNLLLFQIGIHLHTHQDLKLKCCRVMGQKLR